MIDKKECAEILLETGLARRKAEEIADGLQKALAKRKIEKRKDKTIKEQVIETKDILE
jgi:hypothetical protein